MKFSPYAVLLTIVFSHVCYAGNVMIAVANNFYKPMKSIAVDFKQATTHEIQLSTGSTGQLYAQIINGAPFDIFLSADTQHPEKLVQANLASQPFTYAKGLLVLWSAQEDLIDSSGQVLTSDRFHYLAMPDPRLAPYGFAAQQTMQKLVQYQRLKSKIVMGKGLNATYQFIATSNAELGFIALSQIFKNGQYQNGSHWLIPTDLYSPILQDAVLLRTAKDNPAAKVFIEYLASNRAKRLIAGFGYQ